MTAVLLVIHVLVAAGLVATILMQRSEGGALGIGGGQGGAMSGRGAGNLLTRTTMILGAVFMGNSILLAIIANVSTENQSVIERVGGDDADGSGLPLNFDDVPSDDGGAPSDATSEEPAPADGEPPAEDEPEIPGR